MELQYNLRTGVFNQIKDSLKKSVSQYLRHNKKAKIGITSNPLNRFSQHKGGGLSWGKMIVLYETSSVNYINEMEKFLISNFSGDLENEVAGGGGPNGKSPYYLYILLK